MTQETAGPPGVLGRDHRDRAKHLAGARREIAQIAERSRYDIQRAGNTHEDGMSGQEQEDERSEAAGPRPLHSLPRDHGLRRDAA